MSGHSHWSTIKRAKGLADAQRGRVFSKMARLITIAARDGGDPDLNPKLKETIQRAKEFNMPAANVDRAIKRGTGELTGGELYEVVFEAYGPGRIAIIIEGITDNKNRTLAGIKQILNQNNGKLAGEGSVKWMFERKGIVAANVKIQMSNVKEKEDVELKVIDAGAEDFAWQGDFLEVYTKAEELEKVKKKLESSGIKIETSNLGWIAKEEIELSEKEKTSAEKLFEALDENDDVQEIYSNLKM